MAGADTSSWQPPVLASSPRQQQPELLDCLHELNAACDLSGSCDGYETRLDAVSSSELWQPQFSTKTPPDSQFGEGNSNNVTTIQEAICCTNCPRPFLKRLTLPANGNAKSTDATKLTNASKRCCENARSTGGPQSPAYSNLYRN